jgi:hypothetical protein
MMCSIGFEIGCFSNDFELLARSKKPVSGCYSLRSRTQPCELFEFRKMDEIKLRMTRIDSDVFNRI